MVYVRAYAYELAAHDSVVSVPGRVRAFEISAENV
jgi:hypothetical protein